MRLLIHLLHGLIQSTQLCLWRLWASLFVCRPAQGLVEYSLILMLIAMACIAILTTVGRTTSELWYEKIIQAFPGS